MRNLISAGVNAIILDPSSRDALNPVIRQAAQRGIVVVAVDQARSAVVDIPKFGSSALPSRALWLPERRHADAPTPRSASAPGQAPIPAARRRGLS